MRDLPVLKIDLNKPESFGNSAEKLDVEDRRRLANDLIELIAIDEASMSDWLSETRGYLDKIKNKGNEIPQNREQDGSGDTEPPATEMTLSAVIQFAARATDALLGEPDLAKASEPGGEALASWLSSQLRTQDPNWTLDTDPLVVHMAVTGLGWRKRDFDDDDKVFHSHFLTCTEVIINKNVRSIERAPRVTHEFERYPYEIQRSIERGKWVDYEPRFDEADPQAPKKFYETDAWLDLDDDGIDEPWTIVIARDDLPEVVRIRPRWSTKTVVDSDEALFFNPIRRFYPYRMLPDPDGGFFPIGFGKLLSRLEASCDTLLASITDTAKSESQNGGILSGGGIGLPDKIEIKGNRITSIPMDGAKLTDRFVGFPIKSVSPGSVQALDKLMTLADRLAGTLNLMENAPASMTATLAKGIIDTGTQVQSAVHRRLVASMTQEFRMFVQMADAYSQLPQGVMASDGGGVAVTADPQLATEMQRSAVIGLHMEMVKEFGPAGAIDVRAIAAEIYRIARIPNGQQFIMAPQPPQLEPKDKARATIDLMKQQTEKMKVTGAVAVQLTQALKNMVEASGGMLDNRTALLQMAQLEQAVQSLMQEAGNANDAANNGLAQQPSDARASSTGAPDESGNSPDVSSGAAGGSDAAGAGVGAQ